MRALFVYNLIMLRRRLPGLLPVFAAAAAAGLLFRNISFGGLAGVLAVAVIIGGRDDASQGRWLLTMPVSRRQFVIFSYITEAAAGLAASLLCSALSLLTGETVRVALLSGAVIYCLFLTLIGITLCFDFKYGPGGRGKLACAAVLLVLMLMLFLLTLLAELLSADMIWSLLIFPAAATVSVALGLRDSICAFEERDL